MQTRSRAERGFSVIELLAVITLVAVAVGLLFPAVAAVKKQAAAATCSANIRQVGLALLQLAGDRQGILTHWYFGTQVPNVSEHYVGQLKRSGYLTMEQMRKLRCPAIPQNLDPNIQNWGFNLADPYGSTSAVPPEQGGASNSKVYRIVVRTHPAPSRSILLGDASVGVPPGASTVLRIFPTGSASGGRVFLAHQNKATLFFLDGHTELASPERLHTLRESLGNPSAVEYYDENYVFQKTL